MKRIVITEDNVEMYQEYFNICNGSFSPSFINVIFNLLFFFMQFVIVLGWLILIIVSFYITIAGFWIFVMIFLTLLSVMFSKTFTSFMIKSHLKKFNKKYPNFDMSLDVEEIEKSLSCYEKIDF